MKFFASVLSLIATVPLAAQQTSPPDGVTVPLQTIPVVPASSIDPNKIVLQVGDIKITAQQLDHLIDVYPASAQVFVRGPGRQQFADTVVRMLVLAEEARKRKLDQTDKFKEQIRFSEFNLLAGTVTEQLTSEIRPGEEELQRFFDQHRCEYQTWRPRAIVVRTIGSPLPIKPGGKDVSDAEALARAQDLRKRAAAGVDFAALATAESDDPATAANGGDLGPVRHGQILPAVEEAVCRMNAGDLSEPVKSPLGYYVVKLESKDGKTFDEVKPELEVRLRPEIAKKLIEELIARTKVVKDPEYYAADPPAPETKKR